mgnify:CR=1 FL=1
MTILVTGASGFIGSAIVRRLVCAGNKVRGLVRSASDKGNLEGQDIEIVEGDLIDQASLYRAVSGCSGIFHVAADYRLWVRNPREMFRTNVVGTRNIMCVASEAAVEKIVYTSSVATLGLPAEGGVGDEQTPVSARDMIGPYKTSKFKAEQEVRHFANEKGLPVVIVNPSTPVGPGDIKPTPTGKMVVEAASGRLPAFVDTGLSIVHVDDVANGHVLAYQHGQIGERYVLGGQNLSLKEILCEIAAIVGKPAPRVCLPHNLLMPVAYIAEVLTRITGGREPIISIDSARIARKKMYYSSDKARVAFGYSARPAREALQDSVMWYSQHGYIN